MRDLDFISGKFFDLPVSRDKMYLLKYFTSDLQIAFLKYCLVFDDVKLFTNHTGYYCSERLRFKLWNRYKELTEAHKQAKSSLTEEGIKTLHQIETGQYQLTKI